MKQLPALTAFNTFLLVVLLYLHLDLRRTVNAEFRSVSTIANKVTTPIEKLEMTIQQADSLSSDIQKRFDAVAKAIQAADAPPRQFQQVQGVISAEPPSLPEQRLADPSTAPLAPIPLDVQITNETEDNDVIKISGIAPNNQMIARYMQQLAASGTYREVNLLESRQSPDGKKLFIISAKRGR